MIPQVLPLYDQFLDYLVEKATPDDILAFQATEDARNHARILLERQSAGTLTPEETLQLEQMRQFERMMALLKSKALLALSQS